MKCAQRMLLILFTLVCSCTLMAQGDSIRVLFIGNSYTHFNKMSNMVRLLAATQGVEMSVSEFSPGGYTFRQHLDNPDLRPLIEQGGWDYVVMQQQSMAPAQPEAVVERKTYPSARELDSLVHVYSPDAKTIFYMTWGHKNGTNKPTPGYPLIDTYEGMQGRLKTSYLEMAKQNNAWCAPVGMAWQQVRNDYPDYELYNPDLTHPSLLGSYLAANVIFSTIYQKPYHSQYRAKVLSEQADVIQQVAQQVVFDNLELLNIEK